MIPSFIYILFSERIQGLIPFVFLEIFLVLVFLKIFYELFNWYNDVWIITDEAIYDLEWSLLKTKVESIHLESIEGIEIDKHRIWDSIFNKGDIVIHKFGAETVAILNAYNPYKSVDIISSYLLGNDAKEEKQDNFDRIMDALSGVVSNYLHTHGLPENQSMIEELPIKNIPDQEKQDDDIDKNYTIDLNQK